jgi:hypothetical protein
MSNNGDDTTWTRDLLPVEDSAPGDALYETLEDFVLDQSGGEGSSGDEAGAVEERDSGDPEQDKSGRSGDVDEGDERHSSARAPNNYDDQDINSQTSRLPANSRPKFQRTRYTADEETVLYLLHRIRALGPGTLANIFNYMFRAGGIIREDRALVSRWSRHKNRLLEKFANPDPAGLAEQMVWKREIQKAIDELSMGFRIQWIA